MLRAGRNVREHAGTDRRSPARRHAMRLCAAAKQSGGTYPRRGTACRGGGPAMEPIVERPPRSAFATPRATVHDARRPRRPAHCHEITPSALRLADRAYATFDAVRQTLRSLRRSHSPSSRRRSDMGQAMRNATKLDRPHGPANLPHGRRLPPFGMTDDRVVTVHDRAARLIEATCAGWAELRPRPRHVTGPAVPGADRVLTDEPSRSSPTCSYVRVVRLTCCTVEGAPVRAPTPACLPTSCRGRGARFRRGRVGRRSGVPATSLTCGSRRTALPSQ